MHLSSAEVCLQSTSACVPMTSSFQESAYIRVHSQVHRAECIGCVLQRMQMQDSGNTHAEWA